MTISSTKVSRQLSGLLRGASGGTSSTLSRLHFENGSEITGRDYHMHVGPAGRAGRGVSSRDYVALGVTLGLSRNEREEAESAISTFELGNKTLFKLWITHDPSSLRLVLV